MPDSYINVGGLGRILKSLSRSELFSVCDFYLQA